LDEVDISGVFEQLSARKGDCLREAAKGYSAKEIGRVLDLSPHTVNNHILETRKMLGSVSRRKAAQLFAEWEARKGGHLLPPYPMTIPDRSDSRSSASTETQADALVNQEGVEDIFAEEQQPFGVRESLTSLRDIVPIRVAGRQLNDLNGQSTLIVFAILTTLMLFAVGAGISLLLALNGLMEK
jgi:DNA-binding CsgD family transcriptional regulator